MKVYLAGPFFNPQQVAIIEKIEVLLSKFKGLEVYSPRKDGVLIDMSPEERAKAKRGIFEKNVKEIYACNLMVSVVDGRDAGTIWEHGFAFCMKHIGYDNLIVTYTDENFGLNVMIQESVDAHAKGMENLEAIVAAIVDADLFTLTKFHDFNPGVS